MKQMLRLISGVVLAFIAAASPVHAQVDTAFVLVLDIQNQTATASDTFEIEAIAPSDQFGLFTPLGIQVGMGLIDGSGRLYTVTAVIDATFSDCELEVACVDTGCIGPADVGAVYRVRPDSRIPVPADGNQGVSEILQRRIDLHNLQQVYGITAADIADMIEDSLDVVRAEIEDSSQVYRDTFTDLRAELTAMFGDIAAIEDSLGLIPDGSGSARYIAKWQDSNTLTNSIIQDDGTNVAIGATPGGYKLRVGGNIQLSGSPTRYLFFTDNANVYFGYESGTWIANGASSSTFNIRQNNVTKFQMGSTGLFGIGATAFTPASLLEIRTPALGTTQLDAAGLFLGTAGVAASGLQQIGSPVVWESFAYKSNAPAASQSVRFRADVLPVQGTTVGSGTWRLSANINGGGYFDAITVNTNGTTSGTGIYIGNFNASGGDVAIGSTSGTVRLNAGYNNTFQLNRLAFYNGGDQSSIQGFSAGNNGVAIGYAATATNPGGANTTLSIKGANALNTGKALLIENSALTDLFTVQNDGVVGIGTLNDISIGEFGSQFTVKGSLPIITSYRPSSSISAGTGYQIVMNSITDVPTTLAYFNGYMIDNTAGAVSGGLAFFTRNAGSLTAKMNILGDGKVGIGTTTPDELLTVAGKTKTSTIQITTGATNNYILRSDASGNGTWVAPNSIGTFLPLTGGTLTGNLLFSSDNTRDIGAAAATRPRNGYFGTSVVSPVFNATTGYRVAGGATSGNYLRGNGTNFVSSSIQAGDIPVLDYLPLSLTGSIFVSLNGNMLGFLGSGAGDNPSLYFTTTGIEMASEIGTSFNLTGPNVEINANSRMNIQPDSVVFAGTYPVNTNATHVLVRDVSTKRLEEKAINSFPSLYTTSGSLTGSTIVTADAGENLTFNLSTTSTHIIRKESSTLVDANDIVPSLRLQGGGAAAGNGGSAIDFHVNVLGIANEATGRIRAHAIGSLGGDGAMDFMVSDNVLAPSLKVGLSIQAIDAGNAFVQISNAYYLPRANGTDNQVLTASPSLGGLTTTQWTTLPAANLTFTGGSSPYTLNSSTGTDVTFGQQYGIILSRSSNQLNIGVDTVSTNGLATQHDLLGITSTWLKPEWESGPVGIVTDDTLTVENTALDAYSKLNANFMEFSGGGETLSLAAASISGSNLALNMTNAWEINVGDAITETADSYFGEFATTVNWNTLAGTFFIGSPDTIELSSTAIFLEGIPNIVSNTPSLGARLLFREDIANGNHSVGLAVSDNIAGSITHYLPKLLPLSSGTWYEDAAGNITVRGDEASNISGTTDSNGDITVSHALGDNTFVANVTATGTTFFQAQPHSLTSTDFKVRFFDATGAPLVSTAVTAFYQIIDL